MGKLATNWEKRDKEKGKKMENVEENEGQIGKGHPKPHREKAIMFKLNPYCGSHRCHQMSKLTFQAVKKNNADLIVQNHTHRESMLVARHADQELNLVPLG